MSVKKGIGIGAIVLAVICIAWVAAVAIGMGGEANKLKTAMEQDVAQHATIDDVKQHLTALNVSAAQAGTNLTGEGPHHLAVIYSTWLTVQVTFGDDNKARSYHMDRGSGWF